MKVSHEVPVCLLEKSREFNDYDYCLVHLLETNEEYKEYYIRSSREGRMIILDNSVFELGEAFDMDRFIYWINIIKPSHYIIPDALDKWKKTCENVEVWNEKYKDKLTFNSKSIGVVQGESYEEAVMCYDCIKNKVDCVAISFNSKFYETENTKNQLYDWMEGRRRFVMRMLNDGYFDKTKEHHLLGCALPQEFILYKDLDFITSCDTSNPIVHGIYNIKYKHWGLSSKVSQKLCDLINSTINKEQMECIMYNVNKFKSFIR